MPSASLGYNVVVYSSPEKVDLYSKYPPLSFNLHSFTSRCCSFDRSCPSAGNGLRLSPVPARHVPRFLSVPRARHPAPTPPWGIRRVESGRLSVSWARRYRRAPDKLRSFCFLDAPTMYALPRAASHAIPRAALRPTPRQVPVSYALLQRSNMATHAKIKVRPSGEIRLSGHPVRRQSS